MEITEPRQCVFIGTINQNVYLQDETGGRRFWPVKIQGTIDLEGLARDRDQLFAEAFDAFGADVPWWPSRDFEKLCIADQQEARYEVDPWEEPIGKWVKENVGVDRLTISEIYKSILFVQTEHWNNANARRVHKAMMRLGWTQKRDMHGRWWVRVT